MDNEHRKIVIPRRDAPDLEIIGRLIRRMTGADSGERANIFATRSGKYVMDVYALPGDGIARFGGL